MNRSTLQNILALAVQAFAAIACAQSTVTVGDAGDSGPNTSTCDSGTTSLQVAGFQCPEAYPADPTALCMPGAAFQQVFLGQSGTLRSVTIDIGLAETACCYDSSGALAGAYVRDDISHACWGPGAQPRIRR
jgi:hypothetical protein